MSWEHGGHPQPPQVAQDMGHSLLSLRASTHGQSDAPRARQCPHMQGTNTMDSAKWARRSRAGCGGTGARPVPAPVTRGDKQSRKGNPAPNTALLSNQTSCHRAGAAHSCRMFCCHPAAVPQGHRGVTTPSHHTTPSAKPPGPVDPEDLQKHFQPVPKSCLRMRYSLPCRGARIKPPETGKTRAPCSPGPCPVSQANVTSMWVDWSFIVGPVKTKGPRFRCCGVRKCLESFSPSSVPISSRNLPLSASTLLSRFSGGRKGRRVSLSSSRRLFPRQLDMELAPQLPNLRLQQSPSQGRVPSRRGVFCPQTPGRGTRQ